MDSSPPLENGDRPTPSRRTSRTLRKYTDYSIRQIAQRNGIPKSTVYDQISASISPTTIKLEEVATINAIATQLTR
ncbi:hypothetical protein V490_00660 [Pseudogymnoascus sp. VKM F-3557]|nr:hypothetical protein V490_00660 [Pseudogymnoascus sp. VKM F-3557]